MKVLQVSFDTSIITVIIDDNDSLIDMLNNVEPSFKDIDGKMCYEFDDGYTEECIVKDMTNVRGIIQAEAH